MSRRVSFALTAVSSCNIVVSVLCMRAELAQCIVRAGGYRDDSQCLQSSNTFIIILIIIIILTNLLYKSSSSVPSSA